MHKEIEIKNKISFENTIKIEPFDVAKRYTKPHVHNKYLEIVFESWEFIQKHLLDTQNGEWFWGINRDYSLMKNDKAGFWKCPYHNGRACIELIKRL